MHIHICIGAFILLSLSSSNCSVQVRNSVLTQGGFAIIHTYTYLYVYEYMYAFIYIYVYINIQLHVHRTALSTIELQRKENKGGFMSRVLHYIYIYI